MWSLAFIGVVTAFLISRATFASGIDRRHALQMVPIYVIAAIVFITGIWWGIPDYRGWAVDEISPGEVEHLPREDQRRPALQVIALPLARSQHLLRLQPRLRAQQRVLEEKV